MFLAILTVSILLIACGGSAAKGGEMTCASYKEMWGDDWHARFMETDTENPLGGAETMEQEAVVVKMLRDHGLDQVRIHDPGSLEMTMWMEFKFCDQQSNQAAPIEDAIPWNLPAYQPN